MQAPSPKLTPPSPPCQEARSDQGVLERVRREAKCFVCDVDAVLRYDPAARSRLEVCLTYPGLHALWIHRGAHALWSSGWKLTARVVSHTARFWTGVEIHPGARIGRGVFIDHGMGVVIGETAVVGDDCILYKGVVLGGTNRERAIRHPQLGRDVVVGSNACVLGHIRVGDGARIGSGSVVIRDVPDGGTVVGVPGRIVPARGDPRRRFHAALDHANLPDPVTEMLRSLRDQNERLTERVRRLESALSLTERETEVDHEDLRGACGTSDMPPQEGG